MRHIIGSILFILLYNITVYYLSYNVYLWLHIAFGFSYPVVFGIFIFIASYAFVIARVPNKFPLIRVIGSCWFAFVQYGLILIPFANLAYFIFVSFGYNKEQLIISLGYISFFIFIFLFVYGVYNAYSTVLRTFSIQLPKSERNSSNLRIAFASDMHFGLLSGVKHAKRMVQTINKVNADLVLFGGDIIDDHPEPFINKKMGEELSKIRSTFGTYSVLGNHDYYGGKVPMLLDELDRIGVNVLLDKSIVINNQIYLLGRKDYSDKERKKLEEFPQQQDRNLIRILLDHQPHEIKKASEAGFDIILCGHTHRGQMAPNHLITKKVFDLDYGYKKIADMHAFVSSGFGFWGPPLRIGSRSEIMQINIEFIE